MTTLASLLLVWCLGIPAAVIAAFAVGGRRRERPPRLGRARGEVSLAGDLSGRPAQPVCARRPHVASARARRTYGGLAHKP